MCFNVERELDNDDSGGSLRGAAAQRLPRLDRARAARGAAEAGWQIASTPSAPAAPQPPQTLGQILRTARLAQDLTLEQLSTELRIEAKQLQALEEERFEQIGVPVFIKGYLKQYGTRLGLDVRDLLALYYKQTTLADVQIQPSRTIKLRDERQITSWILALDRVADGRRRSRGVVVERRQLRLHTVDA